MVYARHRFHPPPPGSPATTAMLTSGTAYAVRDVGLGRMRGTLRQFITTETPSRLSAEAPANPIPAVDPGTNARSPASCKPMKSSRPSYKSRRLLSGGADGQ